MMIWLPRHSVSSGETEKCDKYKGEAPSVWLISPSNSQQALTNQLGNTHSYLATWGCQAVNDLYHLGLCEWGFISHC